MPNPRYAKKEPPKPLRPPSAPYSATPPEFMAAQSHIDCLDGLAIEMERRWGVGRLRLLVAPEWTAKFDSQAYRLNVATKQGTVEDVQRECARMTAAWRKLDELATAAGAATVSPEAWEVGLPNGDVAILVRDAVDAHALIGDGRSRQLWTLAEVAEVIGKFPEIAKAKQVFPGAKVTAVRRDPVQATDWDEKVGDALPF
jgi:hypothetical protein